MEQMEAHRRQRQAALEEQRAARERAELAQCTFAPAVLPAAPPSQVRSLPARRASSRGTAGDQHSCDDSERAPGLALASVLVLGRGHCQ